MRMTSLDVIRLLLLEDRQLSTAEIGEKLIAWDLPVPTTLLLSDTRSKFLQVLRLLEYVGAIEPDLCIPFPHKLLFPYVPKRKPKRKLLSKRRGNFGQRD